MIESAEAAIETKFNEIWDEATPISWPNVAFTPPADLSPWVQVTTVWGKAEPVTIGTIGTGVVRNRAVGVLYVNVFVQRGTASGTLNALCDAVRDAFNRITVSGVRFSVPDPPTRKPDGQWYMATVACGFTFDETI